MAILPSAKVCESYVFTPVCQSFTERGVCPSASWDTPLCRHPRADTPWTSTHPRAAPPPEHTPPRAVYAGRYGQQAAGTLPTRMQSCRLEISTHRCLTITENPAEPMLMMLDLEKSNVTRGWISILSHVFANFHE